ncbi:hypothetical protein ACWKWU_11370 [Chitinophaga lutea]
MKRILLSGLLIAAAAAFQPAAAQVSVSINIGAQPAWGPVGYDYASYYYMPAYEMYYYVPARQYIYFDGGRWIRTTILPSRFRGYDFYRTYKVVINDRDPWRYHDRYRRQYAVYRTRPGQPVLRDNRDWNRLHDNRRQPERQFGSSERRQQPGRDWNQNDRRQQDRNWSNNDRRQPDRQWNNNDRKQPDRQWNNGNGRGNGNGHNGRGNEGRGHGNGNAHKR